ncbi:MAG: hypothetical protein ACRENZ_06550, partial [Thermodesulfobacteriota bacterium]
MKTYLISALKDYKGTNIKVIQSPSIEATSFASQIVNVLKEAGWEVSDTIGKVEGDSILFPFPGNELYVLADPRTRVEGTPFYLLKALKCIGVDVVPRTDKNLKLGHLKLYIGDKLKGDKLAIDQRELCNVTR